MFNKILVGSSLVLILVLALASESDAACTVSTSTSGSGSQLALEAEGDCDSGNGALLKMIIVSVECAEDPPYNATLIAECQAQTDCCLELTLISGRQVTWKEDCSSLGSCEKIMACTKLECLPAVCTDSAEDVMCGGCPSPCEDGPPCSSLSLYP
jgi:hypothetical protein